MPHAPTQSGTSSNFQPFCALAQGPICGGTSGGFLLGEEGTGHLHLPDFVQRGLWFRQKGILSKESGVGIRQRVGNHQAGKKCSHPSWGSGPGFEGSQQEMAGVHSLAFCGVKVQCTLEAAVQGPRSKATFKPNGMNNHSPS